MRFTETRGNDGIHAESVDFTDTILSPAASFNGIYCPHNLPAIGDSFLQRHLDANYQFLAGSLLDLFATGINPAIFKDAVSRYARFDDPQNPVPVRKLAHNIYVSELYHGPTRAFKDIALQPFGKLISALAQQKNRRYLILAATSGDTGPAALDAFRHCDNVRVVCLYPAGGTSDVQRLQMVTESATNLKIIGIRGNFDDTQTALKQLLASSRFHQALKALGVSLSAANSVNFGRILFQIIYQFHSYLALVRQQAIQLGDEIHVHIPSGNFGNALGAYYARSMGLPIQRIHIASNANNVLTEWINDGRYDRSRRTLIATNAPAMDILKSSNTERLLFDLFGPARTGTLMQELDEQGFYQLKDQETKQIQAIFSASFCTDSESEAHIRHYFNNGYLMDPHTATCFQSDTLAANPTTVNLVYSTAEWTKFAPTIDQAIHGHDSNSDLESLEAVAQTAGVKIPETIGCLFAKPICHPQVIETDQIEAHILAFLQGSHQH